MLYLAIMVAMYSWYPAGTAAAAIVTGGTPGVALGIPDGVGMPTRVGVGLASDGLTTAVVVADEAGNVFTGVDGALEGELEAVMEDGGELFGEVFCDLTG